SPATRTIGGEKAPRGGGNLTDGNNPGRPPRPGGGFSGQKNGARRPRLVHPRRDADKASRLQSDDVLRLGAFLALGDGELNALTFGQGLEARAGDGAEVCEHIRAGFLLDEAKAFCFVEPFNDASGGRHIHILIIKCWYGPIKGRWCWKCSGYL